MHKNNTNTTKMNDKLSNEQSSSKTSQSHKVIAGTAIAGGVAGLAIAGPLVGLGSDLSGGEGEGAG